MEGVEDIPGVVMDEGVPWNWETFPEYLDALPSAQADIDFAAQLPHTPLRVYVMGAARRDREAADCRRSGADASADTEAIGAGAIGVTTTRDIAHRFRDGRIVPSVSTEEHGDPGLGRRTPTMQAPACSRSSATAAKAPQRAIRSFAESPRSATARYSFTLVQTGDDPARLA